jgi:gas vesicle protein
MLLLGITTGFIIGFIVRGMIESGNAQQLRNQISRLKSNLNDIEKKIKELKGQYNANP